MIDLETVQSTDAGTRFHRAVAILLGTIAVLAAALGAVQMDRSQAETRATTQAARLTGDLAAGIPVQGITGAMSLMAMQQAVIRSAAGTTRNLLSLDSGDQAALAEGAAEVAAGTRLLDIAARMGATPDASSDLPPYELRLMTADMNALNREVEEQNRFIDVAAAEASADSSAAVAGLSVLALAGVLVGLASVLGADRAGRATLVMAWLAAGAAAAALVSTFL